jgi:hypothetical protein
VRTDESFKFKGQAYDCVGSFECEIPARLVLVLELYSRCPDCGRGFLCTATQAQVGVPVVLAKPAANVGKRRRAPAPRAIPHTTVQGMSFQHAQKPACEPAMIDAILAASQAFSALSAACRAERKEREAREAREAHEAHEKQVDAYLESLGLLG